jgi:carbonic anhydrase
MEKLLQGIQHFRNHEYPKNREFYERLAAKQQTPLALVITCSDSRVLPHVFTDTEPGDLFMIRNAGNIVPPHGASGGGEAATIQYSLEVLNIRNIIICGHSQCGAMKAILEHKPLTHLPAIDTWFQHAEATRQIVLHKYTHLEADALANAATEENVLVQMNNLSTHPCVAARLAAGNLNIYGWHYDIGKGRVAQYDQQQGRFLEINGGAHAASPMPIRTCEEVAVA